MAILSVLMKYDADSPHTHTFLPPRLVGVLANDNNALDGNVQMLSVGINFTQNILDILL